MSDVKFNVKLNQDGKTAQCSVDYTSNWKTQNNGQDIGDVTCSIPDAQGQKVDTKVADVFRDETAGRSQNDPAWKVGDQVFDPAQIRMLQITKDTTAGTTVVKSFKTLAAYRKEMKAPIERVKFFIQYTDAPHLAGKVQMDADWKTKADGLAVGKVSYPMPASTTGVTQELEIIKVNQDTFKVNDVEFKPAEIEAGLFVVADGESKLHLFKTFRAYLDRQKKLKNTPLALPTTVVRDGKATTAKYKITAIDWASKNPGEKVGEVTYNDGQNDVTLGIFRAEDKEVEENGQKVKVPQVKVAENAKADGPVFDPKKAVRLRIDLEKESGKIDEIRAFDSEEKYTESFDKDETVEQKWDHRLVVEGGMGIQAVDSQVRLNGKLGAGHRGGIKRVVKTFKPAKIEDPRFVRTSRADAMPLGMKDVSLPPRHAIVPINFSLMFKAGRKMFISGKPAAGSSSTGLTAEGKKLITAVVLGPNHPSVDPAFANDPEFKQYLVENNLAKLNRDLKAAGYSPSKSPMYILVEGHTDKVSGWDYNMKLSQRRAKVMKKMIADLMEANRDKFPFYKGRQYIRGIGLGESTPYYVSNPDEYKAMKKAGQARTRKQKNAIDRRASLSVFLDRSGLNSQIPYAKPTKAVSQEKKIAGKLAKILKAAGFPAFYKGGKDHSLNMVIKDTQGSLQRLADVLNRADVKALIKKTSRGLKSRVVVSNAQAAAKPERAKAAVTSGLITWTKWPFKGYSPVFVTDETNARKISRAITKRAKKVRLSRAEKAQVKQEAAAAMQGAEVQKSEAITGSGSKTLVLPFSLQGDKVSERMKYFLTQLAKAELVGKTVFIDVYMPASVQTKQTGNRVGNQIRQALLDGAKDIANKDSFIGYVLKNGPKPHKRKPHIAITVVGEPSKLDDAKLIKKIRKLQRSMMPKPAPTAPTPPASSTTPPGAATPPPPLAPGRSRSRRTRRTTPPSGGRGRLKRR